MKKKQLIFMICGVLLVALGVAVVVHRNAAAPRNTSGKNSSSQSATKTDQTPAEGTTSGFNKQQYSLTDPTSPWVIVNKSRPLSPKTYAPSDLVVPNIPL